MNAILILLLLILAAFVIGWVVSRLINNGGNSESHANELNFQIAERQAELEACRGNYTNVSAKLASANSIIAANQLTKNTNEAISTNIVIENQGNTTFIENTATANDIVPNSVNIVDDRVDDLKIIEGIGPKIEELLNNAGIKSFAKLAETSVSDINAILEAAGPRYQMHNPTTWPGQSALCRDHNWTELKIMQDELNKGKVD